MPRTTVRRHMRRTRRGRVPVRRHKRKIKRRKNYGAIEVIESEKFRLIDRETKTPIVENKTFQEALAIRRGILKSFEEGKLPTVKKLSKSRIKIEQQPKEESRIVIEKQEKEEEEKSEKDFIHLDTLAKERERINRLIEEMQKRGIEI